MDEIKQELMGLVPEGGLPLLQEIFVCTESRTKGIHVSPFRAKHSSQRNVIDALERKFLVREHDNKQQANVYRLVRVALPVLGLDKSERIINYMDLLLKYLKASWHSQYEHAVLLSDILKAIPGDSLEVTEAVIYLKDISGFNGGSLDFPSGDNASVYVSEPILDFESIRDVIEQDLSYMRPSGQPPHFDMNTLYLEQPERLSILAHADAVTLKGWIADLPEPMPQIAQEIEIALSKNLLMLSCMGLRALLDQACLTKAGVNTNFSDAVKELVQNKGLISEAEGRYLLAAYDFGSSVIHRGNVPSAEVVENAAKIAITLLHRLFVLEDAVKDLKSATPPRHGTVDKS